MADTRQIGRHAAAHIAQPNKADFHYLVLHTQKA
jgi:hypothetical protein